MVCFLLKWGWIRIIKEAEKKKKWANYKTDIIIIRHMLQSQSRKRRKQTLALGHPKISFCSSTFEFQALLPMQLKQHSVYCLLNQISSCLSFAFYKLFLFEFPSLFNVHFFILCHLCESKLCRSHIYIFCLYIIFKSYFDLYFFFLNLNSVSNFLRCLL